MRRSSVSRHALVRIQRGRAELSQVNRPRPFKARVRRSVRAQVCRRVEPRDPFGDARRRSGSTITAASPATLGQAGRARRQDRRAARHRFDDGNAEAFPERRQQKHARGCCRSTSAASAATYPGCITASLETKARDLRARSPASRAVRLPASISLVSELRSLLGTGANASSSRITFFRGSSLPTNSAYGPSTFSSSRTTPLRLVGRHRPKTGSSTPL